MTGARSIGRPEDVSQLGGGQHGAPPPAAAAAAESGVVQSSRRVSGDSGVTRNRTARSRHRRRRRLLGVYSVTRLKATLPRRRRLTLKQFIACCRLDDRRPSSFCNLPRRLKYVLLICWSLPTVITAKLYRRH